MKDRCFVTNKSGGRVVYNIKEDGIRREFYPREQKIISTEELRKLAQQPGGRALIYNFLMVSDPKILYYLLNGFPAPEYWITEEKLPQWMESCSLAAFQDALDFAPRGTVELIKKYAVSNKLNDYAKRDAILKQTGFDVTRAIENSDEETAKPEAAPVRRTQAEKSEPAKTEPATPVRRVAKKST